jgi:D-alanyl-D-alanine carboxypeptidase (penicillin-binding protein 5/6)
MDRRRLLILVLLVLALLLIIGVPIWFFTPLGRLFGPPLAPTAAPLGTLTVTPVPKSALQSVLVPQDQPGAILASEAILVDADAGNILYEKNAEAPLPMASTTKIMTALIALQAGNLDQMITVGQDAVDEVTANGGSGARLIAGDQIALRDLLYGLMLPSGDDAAVAIADAIAGSAQNFVTIMNVEAQRLHLYQTRYYNADGLEATDDQGKIINGVHYTTPYDLARLTRYAMSIPLFAQIVQTREYDLSSVSEIHHAYRWTNTNPLLFNYPGTVGVKTGWTDQAGGCLVAAAQRNGHTLISVVLHSSGPKTTEAQDFQTRAADSETLLDWGFSLPASVSRIWPAQAPNALNI